MGLQDVFFQMRLAFDSDEARKISAKVQEEIYFAALNASCELAKEKGRHAAFDETRAANGDLQFDFWGVIPENVERWDALRKEIIENGLRNQFDDCDCADRHDCFDCRLLRMYRTAGFQSFQTRNSVGRFRANQSIFG